MGILNIDSKSKFANCRPKLKQQFMFKTKAQK
jgi:hypothetical protein